MHLVADRWLGALKTWPSARTWGRCALAYAAFLACALPIGAVSGLLHAGLPGARPAEIAGTCLMVLVHPAFVEEMLFRALLLPRNAASMRRVPLFVTAGVALALYVASHPLNAMLFRPQALSLFASPGYLTLVAMLGATCTWAYLSSRSIWPPVAIHWLTVVAWIWLLGGRALL
jgi:predicted Abi (CAAX) family protease